MEAKLNQSYHIVTVLNTEKKAAEQCVLVVKVSLCSLLFLILSLSGPIQSPVSNTAAHNLKPDCLYHIQLIQSPGGTCITVEHTLHMRYYINKDVMLLVVIALCRTDIPHDALLFSPFLHRLRHIFICVCILNACTVNLCL